MRCENRQQCNDAPKYNHFHAADGGSRGSDMMRTLTGIGKRAANEIHAKKSPPQEEFHGVPPLINEVHIDDLCSPFLESGSNLILRHDRGAVH